MTFLWNELLDLANNLDKLSNDSVNSSCKESYYRTAINRTYYGIYHLVLNYADPALAYTRLIGDQAGMNHKALISHLTRSNDANVQMAGRWLFNIQGKRIISDYDEGTSVNESDMKFVIKEAVKIKTKLKL